MRSRGWEQDSALAPARSGQCPSRLRKFPGAIYAPNTQGDSSHHDMHSACKTTFLRRQAGELFVCLCQNLLSMSPLRPPSPLNGPM